MVYPEINGSSVIKSRNSVISGPDVNERNYKLDIRHDQQEEAPLVPLDYRRQRTSSKRKYAEMAQSEVDKSKMKDEREELRIMRAVKQNMYDEQGVQYLDCVNNVAHVGHSHPQVVAAGQNQMSLLVTAQGYRSKILKRYVKTLVESLPEPLSVCYFCNCSSEANDLALRLASQFTRRDDVIVTEDAYHGSYGINFDISPKMWQYLDGYKKKDWVHVTKLPDLYRGEYDYLDEEAGLKYAMNVEEVLLAAEERGREIAAFICEPFFVSPGVHPPPPSYLRSVYQVVRRHGGLVIADETNTGLGRTGKHMWGFQDSGVVPDIVTVGKILGNGYPLGAVICTKEISDKLGGYFSTFGGNPVACSIGLSVLEVIENEKLVSSAKMVGRVLQKAFEQLQNKYECLGDVRGCGLLFALEFVKTKKAKAPDPALAKEIMLCLKTKQILVNVVGRHSNIIQFCPPMCFTIENSRCFVKTLDEVLLSISNQSSQSNEQPRCPSVIVKNNHNNLTPLKNPSRKRTWDESEDFTEPPRIVQEEENTEVAEDTEDNYDDMD